MLAVRSQNQSVRQILPQDFAFCIVMPVHRLELPHLPQKVQETSSPKLLSPAKARAHGLIRSKVLLVLRILEVVRCYVSMYPAGHFRRRQEFTGLRANYLGQVSVDKVERHLRTSNRRSLKKCYQAV